MRDEFDILGHLHYLVTSMDGESVVSVYQSGLSVCVSVLLITGYK